MIWANGTRIPKPELFGDFFKGYSLIYEPPSVSFLGKVGLGKFITIIPDSYTPVN